MNCQIVCSIVLFVVGLGLIIFGSLFGIGGKSSLQDGLFDLKYISDPTLDDCKDGEDDGTFGVNICENIQVKAFEFSSLEAYQICLGDEPDDKFLKSVSSWTATKSECPNGKDIDISAYHVTNPVEVAVDGAMPVLQETDPLYLSSYEQKINVDKQHWKDTGNALYSTKTTYTLREPPTGPHDQQDVLKKKIVVPYFSFWMTSFTWGLENTGANTEHFVAPLVSMGFLSEAKKGLEALIEQTIPVIGLSTIRGLWQGLEAALPSIMHSIAAGALTAAYSAIQTGLPVYLFPSFIKVLRDNYFNDNTFAAAFAGGANEFRQNGTTFDVSPAVGTLTSGSVIQFISTTHACSAATVKGAGMFLAAAASGDVSDLKTCFAADFSVSLTDEQRDQQLTTMAAYMSKHSASPELSLLPIISMNFANFSGSTSASFMRDEYRVGSVSNLLGAADYVLPENIFAFSSFPADASVTPLSDIEADAVFAALAIKPAAAGGVDEAGVQTNIACLDQCAKGETPSCLIEGVELLTTQCSVVVSHLYSTTLAIFNNPQANLVESPVATPRDILREQFRGGALSKVVGAGVITLSALPSFADTVPVVWELGAVLTKCNKEGASSSPPSFACSGGATAQEPLSNATAFAFVEAVIAPDEASFNAAAGAFVASRGCTFGTETLSPVQCTYMQALQGEMVKYAVLLTTGTALDSLSELVARQFYDSAVTRVFSAGEDLTFAGSAILNAFAEGGGASLPTTVLSNLAFGAGCHDSKLYATAASCTFTATGSPAPLISWDDAKVIFSIVDAFSSDPATVQQTVAGAALSFPTGTCSFAPYGTIEGGPCGRIFDHFGYMLGHISRNVPEIRELFGNVPVEAIPMFVEVTVEELVGLIKEDGTVGAIDPWFGAAQPFTLALVTSIPEGRHTEIIKSSGDLTKDVGTLVQSNGRAFDCRTDLDCVYPFQIASSPGALGGLECDMSPGSKCRPTPAEGFEIGYIESELAGHDKGTDKYHKEGVKLEYWLADFWTVGVFTNIEVDFEWKGISVDRLLLTELKTRNENCDGSEEAEGARGIDCGSPYHTKFIGSTTVYPFPPPLYINTHYFIIGENTEVADTKWTYKPADRVKILGCDNSSGRGLGLCDTAIEDREISNQLYVEPISGAVIAGYQRISISTRVQRSPTSYWAPPLAVEEANDVMMPMVNLIKRQEAKPHQIDDLSTLQGAPGLLFAIFLTGVIVGVICLIFSVVLVVKYKRVSNKLTPV